MLTAHQTPSSAPSDQSLALVIDELTRRWETGEQVDVQAFVDRHPLHADQLRRLIPALLALADLRVSAVDRAPLPPGDKAVGELGDFRLIREVGRGGMGVVYEAEQVSLGRRVALKVLPFAAVLDERQLARFKNEARAAATLHHTNIVPVFSVGCERGVHFYVMQYIEGYTLARLIEELRKKSEVGGQRSEVRDQKSEIAGQPQSSSPIDTPTEAFDSSVPPHSPGERPASAGWSDLADSAVLPLPSGEGRGEGGCVPCLPLATDTIHDAASTIVSDHCTNSPSYYRTVARLGIQAAEALQHAHDVGIVHRDIKPANLMLDLAGNLWVTDFGLARLETDAGMTMTGDLLGTLRYMSPEQVAGQPTLVDHRTDVYSLGATLYEVLSLRAVFEGNNREQLLRQVTATEPAPPRRHNPAIPADLQTIVLKALDKNPADRYATAQALADDLRRWLDDKPIVARPPTWMHQARKWSQRHAALVRVGVAMLAVLTVACVAATLLTLRAYRAELHERERAETNLLLAAESIDRLLTKIAGDRYTTGDEMPAEKLPADATELYEQLLRTSDNPDLAFRAGRAYRQVAEIHGDSYEYEKSERAQARAVELLAPLAKEFPDRADYLDALVVACLGHGEVLCTLERHAAAEAPFRQALAACEQLCQRFPAEANYQHRLGHALQDLGMWHWVMGQPKEAESLYKREVAAFLKLPKEIESSPESLSLQAVAHSNAARVLCKRGNYDLAVRGLEIAISRQESAHLQWPRNRQFLDRLNEHYVGLADTHLQAGRHAEAAAAVEKMIWSLPERLQSYQEGADLLLRCAELAAADPKSQPPDKNAAEPSAEAAAQAPLGDVYRQRARELLATAETARIRTPPSVDRFARFLLTCRDESFRDPPRALKLSETVVKAVSGRPSAWFTKSLAHYRLGDFGAADSELGRAMTFAPGGQPSASDLVLLSLIRWRQGQESEARETYAKAQLVMAQQKIHDDVLQTLAAEAERALANADSDTDKH